VEADAPDHLTAQHLIDLFLTQRTEHRDLPSIRSSAYEPLCLSVRAEAL